MPYLSLNGITVRCAPEASFVPVRIGESARSLNGTARKSWRASKREWNLRTPPISKSEADALRALLDGEGHQFPFADLYSGKGLGTSATTGTVTIGTTTPTPKYGSGRIQATGTASATWATNLGTDWTAWLWHYASSTWSHYIITSGGSKWVNGSSNNAASTAFLSVSSGSVTLATVSSSLQADDLVVLPAVIPSAWAAQIYAYHNAQAWSVVPRLVAGGTLVANSTLSVVGEVTGVDELTMGGALYETVGFTLREV